MELEKHSLYIVQKLNNKLIIVNIELSPEMFRQCPVYACGEYVTLNTLQIRYRLVPYHMVLFLSLSLCFLYKMCLVISFFKTGSPLDSVSSRVYSLKSDGAFPLGFTSSLHVVGLDHATPYSLLWVGIELRS